MKIFCLKTIVIVLCLLTGPLTASAEEVLTNRSVERMVAAGLSPEIITTKIKSSRSNFDVSIDTILQLKKNGLDDAIIKAMVEADATKTQAPPAASTYDQGGQYYQPEQRYDADSYNPGAYNRLERKVDALTKLLADIEEAKTLKEKRDYTWKSKAHSIAVTIKTIYPANTHNIKYWWAYAQYSLLVEKEHHILKGLKKVLYFDANHVEALILKGDTCFGLAKDMRPGDDYGTYSQDNMADDAKKAYKKALTVPNISTANKAKVYYHLGEIAKGIDQNKKRAQDYWQKALDADPSGHWGLLAADKLGVVPPQSGQYQPGPQSSVSHQY